MPAERVEDAARALARAALGRPVRDLATTRAGTIQYFLARRSPRRLLDRITTLRMRRLARGGAFEPTGLAGELAARLVGSLAAGEDALRGYGARPAPLDRARGGEVGRRRGLGGGGRRAASGTLGWGSRPKRPVGGESMGAVVAVGSIGCHPSGAPGRRHRPRGRRSCATTPTGGPGGRRLAAMARDGWSALFSTAFAQSKNAMALVDAQRRHVEVNPAYLRLLGYRRDARDRAPGLRVRRRRPAALARSAGRRPRPPAGSTARRSSSAPTAATWRAVGGHHGDRHGPPARALRGARHVALGGELPPVPPRPIPSRARCPRASSRSCA